MSGDYFISWLVKGEKGGKLNDVLHKNAAVVADAAVDVKKDFPL